MGINLRNLALFSTIWKSSWTPPRESILYEPCAEIIDGAESVWDILGAPQDIATATEETLLSVVPQEVFKNDWSG